MGNEKGIMKATTKKAHTSRDQPAGKSRAAHSVRSEDLLPQPKDEQSSINPKWAKHHRRLLELRARLLEEKAQLAEEALEENPTYSMSMADAATDEFDRDLALSQLAAEQDALYEIDEAIHRIENNAYGICELTGRPIPEARLNAVPWTRFIEEAEEQLEWQGAVGHAHLGQVGSTKGTIPAGFAPAPEETETQEPKMEDLKKLEQEPAEEREETESSQTGEEEKAS